MSVDDLINQCCAAIRANKDISKLWQFDPTEKIGFPKPLLSLVNDSGWNLTHDPIDVLTWCREIKLNGKETVLDRSLPTVDRSKTIPYLVDGA